MRVEGGAGGEGERRGGRGRGGEERGVEGRAGGVERGASVAKGG